MFDALVLRRQAVIALLSIGWSRDSIAVLFGRSAKWVYALEKQAKSLSDSVVAVSTNLKEVLEEC